MVVPVVEVVVVVVVVLALGRQVGSSQNSFVATIPFSSTEVAHHPLPVSLTDGMHWPKGPMTPFGTENLGFVILMRCQ